MQVMIGTIEAEVSDDGHDVSMPPPVVANHALVLPFLQKSQAASLPGVTARPAETGATAVAGAPAEASMPMPEIDLDGRLGLSLVLCAIIAGIAAKRFFKKEGQQTIPSWRDDPMDEAAFLRRYGRASR